MQLGLLIAGLIFVLSSVVLYFVRGSPARGKKLMDVTVSEFENILDRTHLRQTLAIVGLILTALALVT